MSYKNHCFSLQTLPVMYDVTAPEGGIGPSGEYRLMPAWETLRVLPYAKGHASVIADMYTLDGEPSLLCPRFFLKRMIAEAAECGFHVQAAFENEFSLLKPGKDGKGWEPVDSTVYCETLAMDTSHDVLVDIFDALDNQGITIVQHHPESSSGQYEIAIRHSDAETAANQQIVMRETIKSVAMKHKLVASFMPKIFPNQAGNGTHMHISLHAKDGTNIMPSGNPNELSPTALYFMAGVLQHLPALMAITVPSTNSYRRLQPGTWSGSYHCWGYANRECPIRVPLSPSRPSPTNFELKTSDATNNPYLSLGSVIAAGLDGVRRKLPIPPPVDVDPGSLSDEELKKLNIERLPSNLKDAIDALTTNEVLLNALQPQLSKALLGVRASEYSAMKDMTLEEEVSLLLQRF